MPEEHNDNVEQELADIIAQIDDAVDESGINEVNNGQADDPEDTNGDEDPVEYGDDQDNKDQSQDDGDSNSLGDETQDDDSTSDSESKARERGWRPKDEFEGDKSGWVDHAEFNRRTELFDKISTQGKTIKSLRKQMDALIAHNKGIEERTRNKTIKELEQKRKEAVKFGDTKAFEEADQQLEEAKKEASFEAEEKDHDNDQEDQNTGDGNEIEIPQMVKDFAAKNSSWFDKDKEMTDFMLWKTQSIVNNQGLGLQEAMDLAEKEVKSVFSSKFKNPNKDKPNTVMGGSKQKITGGKSINSLTPEQKSVWHALKHTMTEKEFLSQLEG